MVSLEQFIISVILGLVQGISEWLPISSKTQVLLASQYLMGLKLSQAYPFGLFMEIGTVLAAIIYFRKDLWVLIMALIGRGTPTQWKLFKFVFIATAVTGIIAVPIYLAVANLAGGYNIGIPMVLLGLILFVDAIVVRYSRSKYAIDKNRKTFGDMGLKEYVLVGVAQGLAALPGVSRSGTTTSTMLLLNIEAKEAFRLSFLVGIFASAAAFFVTLIFSKTSLSVVFTDIGVAGVLIAIAVAAIVSMFLIKLLLDVAGRARIVYLIIALGIIAVASGLAITYLNPAFGAG